MGIQLGRSQPRAGHVGKHQGDLALSDFLPGKNERKNGNRSRNSSPGMSRRSRNLSPAMSRKSSVVSRSDSPREQSEANGEYAVMRDGTETHQAEINKKIKANDKLRKNLTNMPQKHRTLIYGDSFKSKMESLDDEKLPCWQPKGNTYPCKVGSKNRKTIWSESGKRSNRNTRNVWKSCKNGSRLIRTWKQLTPNRYKPNKRCKNCQSRKSRVSISHVSTHL